MSLPVNVPWKSIRQDAKPIRRQLVTEVAENMKLIKRIPMKGFELELDIFCQDCRVLTDRIKLIAWAKGRLL